MALVKLYGWEGRGRGWVGRVMLPRRLSSLIAAEGWLWRFDLHDYTSKRAFPPVIHLNEDEEAD